MTQSLFFAFFLRLALAMGLILIARAWLLPSGWILATLLVFGWASVNALLLVRSIRRSVRPLETAAELLAASSVRRAGQPDGELAAKLRDRAHAQRYTDFDGVARALAQAGREVERALAAVSGSRRELEAMVDSMSDAVVAVDAAGRIQWTNERMQRLLPSSGAQLSGNGPVRIGHALVQTVRDPDVLACVRTAIDGRTLSEARSTSLVPGRIFDVTVSPVPAGGAVAVLRDVTRIEQVERTQRDFVANVSHELRTPLTSITGYVETLLDNESLSPMAQHFLATILKNAARMTRLTDDLLTMARVESDEQKLRPAPVAAEVLVSDAISAVRGLLQETDATLEVGPVCAAHVMADSDATVQVLTNLIENAVKYGRDRATGSSRVVVSARSLEHPSPAIEFSVTDFGPGIASEHIPRIFDRFYRVDKARSIETGGTGLGLAIARHLVEAQAGSIRVESALNQGSSFFVTLPAASRGAEAQS